MAIYTENKQIATCKHTKDTAIFSALDGSPIKSGSPYENNASGEGVGSFDPSPFPSKLPKAG